MIEYLIFKMGDPGVFLRIVLFLGIDQMLFKYLRSSPFSSIEVKGLMKMCLTHWNCIREYDYVKEM
jgi:hypothetical protein